MIQISIITPVYKVEPYIRRCLQSVLSQTYENIECIIVNDATPDKSMEVVDEVLKAYSGAIKFKIINHEKNQGLSAARNSGVRAATGDYLFFLDSDDELHSSNSMELLNQYINKYGEADFFIADYEPIGFAVHYSLPDFDIATGQDVLNTYLQSQWPSMACMKFIKRSFFFDKALFFKEGLLHEDLLFSFRLAFFATTMVVMKERVYKYYNNAGSISFCMYYKNYIDNLFIISENFNLATNSDVNRKLIYSYFVSNLFAFLLSVFSNKVLSRTEKKELLENAKKTLKMWNIPIHFLGYKSCVEVALLHLNYSISSLLFIILSKLL